jgi:general secretion pathway protein J
VSPWISTKAAPRGRRAGLARPGSGRQAGLTLLEVILAVAILAVVVVALAGALRVAVRAWESGERQAAAQQEVRVVVELMTEALAGALPYRGRLGDGLDRVVLFEGEPDAVHFVTSAPPLVLSSPVAPFHAVALGRTSSDELRIEEKLVPTEQPFREGTPTVLSRGVTSLRFQYRDADGLWQDRWDARSAGGIPTAVRVDLSLKAGRRGPALPSLVIPLALGKLPTS